MNGAKGKIVYQGPKQCGLFRLRRNGPATFEKVASCHYGRRLKGRRGVPLVIEKNITCVSEFFLSRDAAV